MRIVRSCVPVLLTALLVTLPMCFVSAEIASSDDAPEWIAEWIGVEQESEPNQWLCYRKVIQLNSVPESATVRIACDSKYWLWLNGQMIVREGQLKRGPTAEATYFDQIDVGKYLQVGENSIAILVWHFGKDGFSHHSSGRAAMVFQGQLGDQVVCSDGSWKAIRHPAFGDTEEPFPNFRLPESNIQFDAQLEPLDAQGRRWFELEFDDQLWAAVRELGSPPDKPWGPLIERPIPQWKDFGLKDFSNQQSLGLPRISDGQTIKAVLPYNAQVNPFLTVRSDAGKSIDIRMDNYRGGSAPNVRAQYITREGKQSYESLGWMSGHEVHYRVPKGIEILDLKYRETGFDTEFDGTFRCDDAFLNRLRQKSVRTLYITMRDTYLDCPDRERAQWWGDVVLQMGESFYALDTRSHSLARKGILELMAWQREDGSISSPVPAGNYDKELPMQMLASVGYFGFWTYAMHTGDLDTIGKVYPRVERYMNLWQQGEDGLVVPRKGGWRWGDWGKNKDFPLLYNGWYYLAIRGQANMAQALGKTDELALLEQKLDRLKIAFNKTFWTGTEYRSPRYKGLTDDRGHALAVVSGIADRGKFAAIADVFEQQFHSSPYMEKYVMEALYQMRRPEQALERVRQRYHKMVAAETTTLWEGWGIGDQGYGGGTINHAWSGGPLTIMSQYIAGIRPTAMGYKEYEVRPQLGSLKNVRAVVQTVAGELKVDISDATKQLRLNLDSPPGTMARICIPDQNVLSVEEAGVVVWSSNDADLGNRQPNQAIRFLKRAEGYLEFEVQPGTYDFQAKR